MGDDPSSCLVLYAHGGGYARGEARMYLNYMERWQREAEKVGLELTFLSVEYRMLLCPPVRALEDHG